MGLGTILSDFQKVKAEVLAGNYLGAWEATIPVQQEFINLGKLVGFKSAPDDAKNCAELEKTIKECITECDKPSPKTANMPVSKLFPGDGSVLKMLFEMFLKLLPLFIKPQP